MLTLREIHEAYDADSVINDVDIAAACRAVPRLCAKYLRWLAEARLLKRQAETEQKQLQKSKFLYYTNKLSDAEIAALGWAAEPLGGLKIMRADLHHFVEADADLQAMALRVEMAATMVSVLDQILKELSWRGNILGHIIKIRTLEAGGV